MKLQHRTKQALAAAMMAAAGGLGVAHAAAPVVAPNAIEQGRYLGDAEHCDACHTVDPNRPYAGNRAMESKFGTIFSWNITPDPKTGIGKWTEAQFTSALRQGRGRHGEYLYPSMP
jgi:hypothetical protein